VQFAVLIDLDGTLADTAPDLAASVDIMLRRLGRPKAGEDQVRNWVGNGIEVLVGRALGPTVSEDEALRRRALELFLPAYRANNGRHARLYPGVEAGLQRLTARGVKLACVTNKPRAFTLPLLVALGIRSRFSAVVSGDDTAAKKPDPAPVHRALELLDASPARALFVGDSVHDVEAGRRAGLPVACVPYGYNHGEHISRAKPDHIVDSLLEIETVLISLLDGTEGTP